MAQEARQGVSRTGETPAELERYMADQQYEYTHWVASQDIYAGTALAFPKGYPVPLSTVVAQGYEQNKMVERPANYVPEVEEVAPVVDLPVAPAPVASVELKTLPVVKGEGK